jgi:hypothetical protein
MGDKPILILDATKQNEFEATALELAAKVRGYFTNRYGKVANFNSIPAKMDGDRDLYQLASKLTKRVMQPGGDARRRLPQKKGGARK